VAAATARANGEPRGEGLLLVLANDPVHFADGSLTREARWPQTVIPRPVLLLAEEDAEAAGLADGRRAVIQGPGGRAEVEVVTDAAQARGQARASAAFPEVRDVFGWKLGGPDAFEPVRVRVGKV
jgi:anaerobic selenocysteine-containing dehydrogenase